MIPRLSVVIPTYNEAARIESTLATLTGGLPPAVEPWEIVVADDGSADATCALVTDAAARDPRIRAGAVIRLENLGPDFSGDYRVVSATHSMGASGYVTQFEVMKEIIAKFQGL